MKRIYPFCLFILATFSYLNICGQEAKWKGPSVDFSHGPLIVSENGRFLIFKDGTPFLYLGDTAWELFHRLTIKETNDYLENRREKGFTVIQSVLLAELDGLNTPNQNGDKPLFNNDPAQPNEAYFKHVDKVLEIAKEKGLFIGVLPTWGDKVDPQWGIGPGIFTPENAEKYGRWLGDRYKDHPNIIWIIGGDRRCSNENYPIWKALAKGIKSVDKNHLMTYHPIGSTSSSFCFHQSDWLDFNMLQSGHGDKGIANYDAISRDYALTPLKPCMDGEPCYEDHPVQWNQVNGWFDEEDVRKAAYWALFAGAHGHTYGCHPIWQMYDERREPISQARHFWHEVLDLPGAWDMIHVRKLLESRPVLSRIPDQSIVLSSKGSLLDHIQATRGEGYAFIYLAGNINVSVRPDLLQADMITAWWYNPRNGEAKKINDFPGTRNLVFTPPVKGIDWVLVLDDKSKNYPPPGAK